MIRIVTVIINWYPMIRTQYTRNRQSEPEANLASCILLFEQRFLFITCALLFFSSRNMANISLRNINSLKRKRSKSPLSGGPSASSIANNCSVQMNDCESQNMLNHSGRSMMTIAHATSAAVAAPRIRTPADKFDAFGNFIVSSLTDLPEHKALELVEKFTCDIVKALLSKDTHE